MPLKSGRSQKVIQQNISELHKGKTYKQTISKYGKKRADDQAVAIAMEKAGLSKKRVKRKGKK